MLQKRNNTYKAVIERNWLFTFYIELSGGSEATFIWFDVGSAQQHPADAKVFCIFLGSESYMDPLFITTELHLSSQFYWVHAHLETRGDYNKLCSKGYL